MKYLNKLFAWMGSDGMSHLILSAIIAVVLASCSPKEVVYVPKVQHVMTTIYAHDTVVTVKVPENYVEVTSLDTLSVLTLPFAESRAVVTGGRLTHSLGTHGELHTSVRIEERVVTIRDSIPYPVEVEVIREVGKPLRGWQVSLMWVGGIAIAIGVGVIFVRLSGIALRS